MEGERPPEGVPPEDDAAATELAELQEAVLGRWVVVAKQASCREHPDKKSCLIGRYLQESVVEITEVAPGTPYMRSRTPPQGLAGAAYTHHANGGWVKEVTSKKEPKVETRHGRPRHLQRCPGDSHRSRVFHKAGLDHPVAETEPLF